MAEFAPDQGWASYQEQIRLHPPPIPVPQGPGDVPAAPATPVNTGPRDSAPAAAASGDIQQAAVPPAIAAAPPSAVTADSIAPSAMSAPPPGSSVFADSGTQPFPVTPSGGGSVFPADSAGDVIQTHYASYGWYVVPSIGNDPGYMHGSGADSEWGFADAGYAADWYFAFV